MERNLNKQSKNTLEKWLICLAILFVLTAISMPFAISMWYKRYEDYSGLAALGPVGDFIGGSTMAFFNLASILLLVATLIIQRKELRATQREYQLTNNTMIKQQFENTFFNMINLQNEIVNTMSHNKRSGREALKLILFDLWARTKGIDFEQDEYDIYINVKNRYAAFFEANENNIAHYLRNLYRIVKIISNSDMEEHEKKNYFGILRAQWSKDEFFLIYLNLFSEDGMKFKNYVKQYDILDIETKDETGNIILKETVPFDRKYFFLYEKNY
ncbi:putative phage abortive infection protein [Bacillus thermotolerans]|uniref:putative phage abortive infection protein n=1 Tax=Bacillus thermotolerans TaxID=1221996 RepID=UPI00057D58AE|nr:putative phage abortive infection protein [Bacillus thermotolerans]KKB35988.1 hypothetical protein QY97_01438 [Bacillus thermotolerans]